ncbi:LLM class flavin-dependent oxidoreductase [Agrobacterium rhizogenes]|uniref:LLM class flavin-dependent oxidoreductase n=1 Tax=Rhizobium rhizogenes TaxID=359 RepID=UPI001375D562|nr:LLM class flavin-dependent oxidoreductase [Rhizobium rhizogenes]NTG39379.1 LLM class flavin-dependent oxidoreductase [Rhizobium rhizogenes]NTG58630.1 LLM class flavin-dependent oxidoreductase [Rhizobium rhizogenes]NTI07171.1 LLM class flavin-dependent oxidoreductase [Rhizobium rhizogenes]NTI13986.1 LLM class flavin-dependent oxidoreductase [Rhizobium rhizogenes]
MLPDVTVIGTCPTYTIGLSVDDYVSRIRRACADAERNGWKALLVYSDHAQIDPWVAADCILKNSTSISPLVAIQPLYMHPFSVAKLMCSLSLLYERAIHLNFISGGFPRDLETLCDAYNHDERYGRVIEYGKIISRLLSDGRPLTFRGKYYSVDGLQLPLANSLPSHCASLFTISGSSAAGLEAAKQLGARAIQYLRPFEEYNGEILRKDLQYGTRIGIIARSSSEDAWAAATKLYPANSIGEEVRRYFTRVSDSIWVKKLGKEISLPPGHPYWLGPYKTNQAACPFLVGKREDVARELAGYMKLGLRTFLVEQVESEIDAEEIRIVFDLAAEQFT